MKLRYELIDTHHPEWKGQRFTSIMRAQRELDRSVPPGRFRLIDRQTKERIW